MPSLLHDPDYSPPSDDDESQVSFTIEDLIITPPTSPVQVVKKRKVYSSTNTTASWIWCHFKKLDMKKEFALCLVCDKEVYYSKNIALVC
jgi:hypothetical protein